MHPQPENLKQASRGRWNALAISSRHRRLARMKSFLGMLFTLLVLTAVIGGGALLWYLSKTTEFSRKPAAAAAP